MKREWEKRNQVPTDTWRFEERLKLDHLRELTNLEHVTFVDIEKDNNIYNSVEKKQEVGTYRYVTQKCNKNMYLQTSAELA